MKQKQEIKSVIILMLVCCITSATFSQSAKDFFNKEYIENTMKKATAWQLENLFLETPLSDGGTEPVPETGWIRGVFYTGMMATYRATGDDTFLKTALHWGEKNNWEFGPRTKHADDQVAGQTYAGLFFHYKDEKMIKTMQETFDYMLATPEPGEVVGWSKNKNWMWCDALYMAPPAMAKLAKATGDPKYLYLMNTMWWECYHLLYSEEDNLFYRDDRYVPKPDGSERRTKSGKKVFWGRGNGWVIAGLAQLIPWLPEDYPSKSAFVSVYSEMAQKIASLQQEDGLWRSSLYDVEEYPIKENSSSGFFCFALAWGINEGYLTKINSFPRLKKPGLG